MLPTSSAAPPLRTLFRTMTLTAAWTLAACNRQQPVEETAAPVASAEKPVPGPALLALADSNAAELLLPYGRQYPASGVVLHTRLGDITVKLYDDTPIHKANFLLLARRGVFDETVFNRVVKGFAVQGGASDHRTIRMNRYRLPPEIKPHHLHRRGALGMARYDDEQNPGQLSSSTDFYFVLGEKLSADQSKAMAGRPLTAAQQRVYATVGGVPSLDGKYTVFGEVTDGLDVIERIGNEPVDAYKWPLADVSIKVEILP
ncbi:peptidylprolyl isomerase [Hymenobacter psychrotolerans]|uniref:Peptidyl-prolyl cis-trans isomerase n=1 Tax=Hymenobacter psychrotolerans DSM 18569 TaxID=1121959 RepID=A0A1M7AW63_9BACT|nr:peptidylprolyl isomerase [Hymenobacter psychrotolerans]SHL46921.1 peptidyl-prolyl cis-trans isomerase B (cyclophilin B) [Hymenobacter psychrotolerans DSM 18569]